MRKLCFQNLFGTLKYCLKQNNFTYCEAKYYSQINPSLNVFNRKNKRAQKKRSALNPDAHLFEYLKRESALQLVDRITDVKRLFPLALDLGCGRGFVSAEITNLDGVDSLIQGDDCKENLYNSLSSEIFTGSVVMEEEKLPFRENTFDLVLSSFSLHWVNDISGCFKEVLRVLKKDGCFIAVMCGSDTLYELRCAFQLAETEREGGVAPHISPMIQGNQLSSLVSGAGFNLVTLDHDEIVVNYPSMFELMEDLQSMGENSAIHQRKTLNRDTLMAAAAIYQAMYGDKDACSVPATFQLLFMIGWKPDESQQKPLDRGAVPKGFKTKS